MRNNKKLEPLLRNDSNFFDSFRGSTVPFSFAVSGCLGIDPAVASGPLITTINDLVAVTAYYGLAWVILLQWMQFA